MRKRRFSLLGLTGAVMLLPRLRHHRPRARSILTLGAISITALGISVLAHPTPRLVWNGSASAPIGLYWIVPGKAKKRGDLVLAWLPDVVRRLAAERSYLPADVPLVKRVAAVANDTVCSHGTTITIDGRAVAERLSTDSRGRPLPGWQDCRTLRKGQVFLLMQGVPDSFDGRYFGPVESVAVIGRLVPLWTR